MSYVISLVVKEVEMFTKKKKKGSGNCFENPINEKIVNIIGYIFYCHNLLRKQQKEKKRWQLYHIQ